MAESVATLLDPALPEDWRRVEVPQGVAFARATDLDRHDNDVQCAQLCLFIFAADAPNVIDFSEELMARRVRQGYPERFSPTVAGIPALGFEWTDGVAHIRSYFVPHPRGPIIEFQIATTWSPDEPPLPPLPELADRLMRHVRLL